MTGVRRGANAHGVLQYPVTARIRPEDFLGFCEAPGFYDDCKAIEVNDDDVLCVEFGIMLNPRHGDIVAGGGGLRRLVCRHVDLDKVFRVFYSYFGFCNQVIFYGAEPGDEEDHFSDEELKVFRQLIAWERRKLARGTFRTTKGGNPHDARS